MTSPETPRTPETLEVDNEATRRKLGHLGFVDALEDDTSTNPIHLLDNLWQQPETD